MRRVRPHRRRQVDAARRRDRAGAALHRRRRCDGDVLLDGASIVDAAAARARPRRRATSARTRPPGSSPTRSRRSWPTAWSSSGCRPTRCAGGSRRRSTCSASPTCARRDLRTLSGGQQQRVAIGVGAHHAPAAARARRADLGARPDRRRGRAGDADPARARPRGHRADGRAPAGAGRAVRRPDGLLDRRRPGLRRRARRRVLARLARSCRRSSSSVGLAGWQPLPLSVRDARRRARRLARPVAPAAGPAAGRRRRSGLRRAVTVAPRRAPSRSARST